MKQMAQFMVDSNKDIINRYGTEIVILNEPNHISVQRLDEEEIIPYSVICQFRTASNGIHILRSVSSVHICLNSIYLIAKYHKERPMKMLEIVLDSLFDGMRAGIYHKHVSMPYSAFDKNFKPMDKVVTQ